MRSNPKKRRTRYRFIAPSDPETKKEFILYQYKILCKSTNKHHLPEEYFNQLIGLLEEIEEYEKCKEVLEFKKLIY